MVLPDVLQGWKVRYTYSDVENIAALFLMPELQEYFYAQKFHVSPPVGMHTVTWIESQQLLKILEGAVTWACYLNILLCMLMCSIQELLVFCETPSLIKYAPVVINAMLGLYSTSKIVLLCYTISYDFTELYNVLLKEQRPSFQINTATIMLQILHCSQSRWEDCTGLSHVAPCCRTDMTWLNEPCWWQFCKGFCNEVCSNVITSSQKTRRLVVCCSVLAVFLVHMLYPQIWVLLTAERVFQIFI